MPALREREKQKTKKSSARRFADAPPGKERTSFSVPDGYEQFKPKAGTFKADFMPYRVKSKQQRHADVGELHFEREYHLHKVPTAAGTDSYVCAADAFGKACAVCDYLTKNRTTIEPDLAKSLRAQVRNLYLVNEDPGNSKNKPKVFDQPYYGANKNGFGQQMVRLINAQDEDVDLFGLEDGSTLVLTIEEDTISGNKWYPVTRIDVKARKTKYSEEVVALSPCLDECLIEPAYDKVMSLLTTGVSKDDDKDEVKPKKEEPKVAKSHVPDPEDDDDDLDDDEEHDEDLEDEDEDEDDDLDDEDDDLDDDDED